MSEEMQGGMPFDRFLGQAAEFLARAKRKYAALDGWVMQQSSGEDTAGAGAGTPPADIDPANVPDQLPLEDVKGLKAALQAERENAKRIKEMFRDIDPQKYRELQQLEQRQEELNASLAKQKAELESNYQRMLAAKAAEVEAERKQRLDLITRMNVERDFQAAGGLLTADSGDGISVSSFDVIFNALSAQGTFRLSEDGQRVEVFAGGQKQYNKDGEPMTPAQYFEKLKTSTVFAHYFQPAYGADGTGTRPNTGRPSSGEQDWRKMSPAERLAYGMANPQQ